MFPRLPLTQSENSGNSALTASRTWCFSAVASPVAAFLASNGVTRVQGIFLLHSTAHAAPRATAMLRAAEALLEPPVGHSRATCSGFHCTSMASSPFTSSWVLRHSSSATFCEPLSVCRVATWSIRSFSKGRISTTATPVLARARSRQTIMRFIYFLSSDSSFSSSRNSQSFAGLSWFSGGLRNSLGFMRSLRRLWNEPT